MKVHCSSCGELVEDYEYRCPLCGSILYSDECSSEDSREVKGIDCDEDISSIEELQEWVSKHRIPIEEMRITIGEKYSGCNLKGIYKDRETGEFVIYRQTSSGEYIEDLRCDSESLAVSKIKWSIEDRISSNKGKSKLFIDWDKEGNASTGDVKVRSNVKLFTLVTFLVFMFTFILLCVNIVSSLLNSDLEYEDPSITSAIIHNADKLSFITDSLDDPIVIESNHVTGNLRVEDDLQYLNLKEGKTYKLKASMVTKDGKTIIQEEYEFTPNDDSGVINYSTDIPEEYTNPNEEIVFYYEIEE